MSKEKMVPEIRFNKYNLVWKSETLKNIATFSKGKGYKRSDVQDTGIPIIFYGDMYTNFENIITQVSNFVNEKPNSVKSSGGEVIIPSSGETAEDIAVASVVKDKGVILGGDLNIIKTQEELEPHYLALSLTYGKSKNELIKRAQGSSIIHLYNNDIKTSKIIYPSLEEQQKIGQLFEKLDQAISLQKQVLEATKDYKQSMLKKMFPKKGEKVPEIRFNGFNLDWKKCKLGDRGKTISGTGFPKKEQGGLNGIPFYKVSDMNLSQNKNTMYVSNNYVSQSQVLQKKWEVITDTPAVIFAKVGAAIMLNRKRLANKPFLIDNNMMAFIPNTSEIESTFIKILFETIFLPKYAQVGALPSYNGSDIEAIPIKIPTLNEQQKIGSFFKTLDEKIEQEEKKLEIYKSMKKALMQRMFV